MGVVLAARHDVVYVGVVGDDEPGEMFTRDLTGAGVSARLQVAPGPTGVVVAVVAGDGERAMMTDRGVNSLLSWDTVAAALAEHFDHLHVSGYTVLDDATRPVASAALGVARARGASTSLDVCSVGPLTRLGASEFLKSAGRVTILFANEEEALLLAGASGIEAAGPRLRAVADEVVITRGGHGATVFHDDEVLSRPSKGVEVVDTTGAGDAATGAYLSARLNGMDCEQALIEAMEIASTVVRGLGSRG